MSKYPFEESWPVNGFTMADAQYVQIRVVGPVVQGSPPFKGYPPIEGTRAYQWWEVILSFRTERKYSPDGFLVEVKNKSGKVLKSRSASQCIARFKTKEDAHRFVHHMHQCKNRRHFFPPFPDTDAAESEKT